MEKYTNKLKKDFCRNSGGGPANKDTEQLDELLTGIMENQQPLENIRDDDH